MLYEINDYGKAESLGYKMKLKQHLPVLTNESAQVKLGSRASASGAVLRFS